MRKTEYRALFEGWCSRHKELQENGCKFSELHLSRNPMQQELDMSEFYGNLRYATEMQAVLQNYDADYEGQSFDDMSRYLHGALIILDKVDTDDWAQRNEALDKTERMAEEILAAVVKQLNESYDYFITPSDLQTEDIGPVNGYHGTRLSFRIKQQATPSLHFNPDLFE
ncbi:hypothetical protein [uncultured Pontibacter sp.]|uniref:hypothetical protein n=1 Tax=uncultured Pontibacter sp. TaxID=453356 RepID=UPI0026031880|nr:hypothetical protein [uncultured Pontibacter sp.]